MKAPTQRDSSKAGDVWTTRRLLTWIGSALQSAGVESPRLCAELLVAHVIGCERLRLYVDSDRPASTAEREQLRALVSRALRHEPVQHLVGEAWFFSLPFKVDHRVLVPRPETETMVEAVLQHARAAPELARGVIADIGAGSGCISIALLKNLPHAHGLAIDVSPDALDVARRNAEAHGVLDRLELIEGDLLTPLRSHPAGSEIAYLVSNPPYIPDSEWEAVPANVKREPHTALRGGPDGLQFIRPLIEQGWRHLLPGGMLAIEFAASKASAVLDLARQQETLTDIRIERDFEARPRVLIAHRKVEQ